MISKGMSANVESWVEVGWTHDSCSAHSDGAATAYTQL
jgi:hypothetical protein